MHHDNPLAGHLGLYRMTRALAKRYWWKGMYHECRQHVRACRVCQAAKVSTQKPPGLLKPLGVPDYVFEECTMDNNTHLPLTDRGYDAIATFVDRMSKYVYFVPCKSMISAEELA